MNTEPTGVPYVVGGDVIQAGSTVRIAGDGYVSAPPGTDLIFVGVVVGPDGGLLVFKDVASESYLRVGAPGESTPLVERGADDERVNHAFDSVLASMRPAP